MVYPRRCGGTRGGPVAPRSRGGLSPQVRGNRTAVTATGWSSWSIPAGAGEPTRGETWRSLERVYPRRCGGTAGTARGGDVRHGLSPQVRGNHVAHEAPRSSAGSIPAGAGEPGRAPATPGRGGVYPRRCGGTSLDIALLQITHGLSPQVRGNRIAPALGEWWPGSIPAGAGEPRGRTPRSGRRGVYPRRCGGTAHVRLDVHLHYGLSPQVRGNPRRTRRMTRRARSIPAGAGEPQRIELHPGIATVYPRRCGGTTG